MSRSCYLLFYLVRYCFHNEYKRTDCIGSAVVFCAVFPAPRKKNYQTFSQARASLSFLQPKVRKLTISVQFDLVAEHTEST